jgi:hypothetical protein
MPDLDLTAAVDAAARTSWERHRERTAGTVPAGTENPTPPWESLHPMGQHTMREAFLPVIAAAAPLIEAAVRERAARDVEAHADGCDGGFADGLGSAARIVRGEA